MIRASMLACTIAAACGFATRHRWPASDPPATAPAPAAAPISLAHAIRTLQDEARKSQATGALARGSATFADEVRAAGNAPPAAALIEKITRRIDGDPFIDAYVRWQLTSFDPPLEAANLEDREFARLVDSLPRWMDNPRADMPLIQAMQAASARGVLTQQQQDEVNERLNQLATKASAAAALNAPAEQFFDWLIKSFRQQPQRVLALQLRRAESLAIAGWPCDEAKAALDRAIEKAARDRAFTTGQRAELARAADRSVTKARMFIAAAGLSEGTLSVNFGTTGIYDFDARRWIKAVGDEW